VSLESDPVVLSQLAHDPSGCLLFHGLVDIDDSVRVTIELDVFDDGESEFVQAVSGRGYAPFDFEVDLTRTAPSTRVIIRKQGAGRAVLAQAFVDETDGACQGPSIEIELSELGAACEDDIHCESGACAVPEGEVEGVCSRCSQTAPCEDDRECLQDPDRGYFVCEDPARGEASDVEVDISIQFNG